MSEEQQSSRICEAPSNGWVVWLSPDAFELVKGMLESVSEDADELMETRKLAIDILEGIY